MRRAGQFIDSGHAAMSDRRRWFVLCAFALAVTVALLASTGRAADPEGCLTCHQYRGLTRIGDDGKSVAIFYVNPNYWDKALGPHAHLKCTDCHQRAEVEVLPHHPTTAVDCSRVCHLDGPGGVEVRFSHDRIDHFLGQSIHGKDALAEANHLLGDPLRSGQSQCLLCHDEPVFRRAGESRLQAQASLGRCDSCHDEQLPKDTRYAYWHVHARSEPARTNLDMARLCATCHSNAAVRAKFDLHDTTASYLVSFHGKAALLGSQETASCLDCHVAQTQNVHLMLSHSSAGAPTNERQLGDTCRSPACHRAAGQNISTAAIHLDLATDHGVEFFIACVFVVLIVFTFGPSLLITALKMLHEVIGRHDPAEHGNLLRVQVLSFFKNLFVRAYSLAILVLICWAGWLAATYLRHSVFLPRQVPANLLQWQGRVDVAALRQQNVPGVTGTAGRAPLGHYHGVDRWFQEDLTNTCTTIGCHEPLPHGPKTKVPAFANFHSTFLDCRMCHADAHAAAGQKARVTWISTTTGRPHDLPAIMALLRFLDTKRDLIGQDPEAAHRTIAGLLKTTLDGVGQDPALEGLLEQMQTCAPGGPVWRQAVDELGQELPLHVRGEYAAKLAPLGTRDPSTDAAKVTASQTAAYLAAADGPQRAGLKDSIHAPLLKEAVSCVACHDEQASMLDFEALGYSTQRATALRTLPLARMMQRIRQGEFFYIPQILEGK